MSFERQADKLWGKFESRLVKSQKKGDVYARRDALARVNTGLAVATTALLAYENVMVAPVGIATQVILGGVLLLQLGINHVTRQDLLSLKKSEWDYGGEDPDELVSTILFRESLTIAQLVEWPKSSRRPGDEDRMTEYDMSL